MREREPQPHTLASKRIARLLGPGLLLILLTTLALAWTSPDRDRQRFVEAQQAGLDALPPPPEPDKAPGIDNRALAPVDKAQETEPNKPPPHRRMGGGGLGGGKSRDGNRPDGKPHGGKPRGERPPPPEQRGGP